MKERIQVKHDLAENWQKAVNFIPLPGEIIIYDGVIESNKENEEDKKEYVVMPRIKLGDGITKVNDLPFVQFGGSNQKAHTEGNKLVFDE